MFDRFGHDSEMSPEAAPPCTRCIAARAQRLEDQQWLSVPGVRTGEHGLHETSLLFLLLLVKPKAVAVAR